MKTIVCCLFLFLTGILCIPEPGTFIVPYNKDQPIHAFYKSVYNGSRVGVQVNCKESTKVLDVSFVLRYSPCSEEYIGIEEDKKRQRYYLELPQVQVVKEFKYTKVEFIKNVTTVECTKGNSVYLPNLLFLKPTISEDKPKGNGTIKTEEKKEAPKKSKREATGVTTASVKQSVTTQKTATTQKPKMKVEERDHQDMLTFWQDGYYVFVLRIEDKTNTSDVDVVIHMHGDIGYISAVDWPLLIFYGVMGIVYIIFGLIWLVLLACSWKDLLRVQFWIGGVIVLGMLEKAVFYGEYQSIQATGSSVPGAIIFAELVSCLKRALARMLVIIVSLGFGIVKPRLGTTLHKVLAVGFLYFILASIEGCMRGLRSKGDQSSDQLIAEVPLAVTDASICWWIFSSLIQTTRTLRLRRNVVKLSLYRHFTNTLIFNILASVAYMLWSLTQHKMKTCVTDWRELWVDEAFWHLLFSVLLCVIMILWRPSANNQRYAFSPLLDAADEEDEAMMNDAYDGMKMRGVKGVTNGSPKNRNSVEDDLKWVEENIPTSVTDKALPSLLDSDEEMMTTRYEVNKMQ